MVSVVVAGCVLSCGRTPTHIGYASADGDAGQGWPEGVDPAGNGGLNGASHNCEKIDFLFVIDNSGSMEDNQAKLVANYDAFIDGILESVQRVQSIHVGVVTTDAYRFNRSECSTLGGLVLKTGGANASQEVCGPYASGGSYMTEEDDLDEAFRCAAQVGTTGSGNELMLRAAVSATSAPLTDPGACNEGFVRDDALLVQFLITDEDVDIDPVFAAAELLANKRGGLADIVTVALGNPPDGECGLGSQGPAFGLDTYVNLFRHGFFGAICEDDYTDVLRAAADAVAEACPGN